ncbi:MAG: CRISPR system precrRNA processing endoribonuclease RAMP protein Cas6 [Chloroflexi bacterium]|nr:CRISPR system precrRNA processing endoribonuclease RAMP protein Cas6 [Chloroflexota bacterium]
MPDLAALVLHLRAARPALIDQHLGRALQAFVLRRILEPYDAGLSAALHRAGGEARPYTAHGLFTRAGTLLRGEIAYGEEAWLRVSALRADVGAALEAYAARMPAQIEIDRQPWIVTQLVWDDDWSGRSTYPALSRPHIYAPPPGALRLHFAAPTAFHSGGLNFPLPDPRLVFGSLAQRWAAFSPLPLPDELNEFVTHFVALGRFNLESHLLRFKQGSRHIGFCGHVRYLILPENPKLSKNDPARAAALAQKHDDLARALALLTDFAFYSGVGIKTTTGMGLARPVV